MTADQTYFDGLVQQGYPVEQATSYTQQYYPGFMPAVAPASPAPIPQPVAQPMMQQPIQQIPQQMAQPQMMAAPMGMAPVGVAPMISGERKPIMTWAAIACIVIALLLSVMGQFGNSWQTTNDDSSIRESDISINLGLQSMIIDCTDSSSDELDSCISYYYVLLSEDTTKAATETAPSDPLVKGDIENFCENSYSSLIGLTDNDSIRAEAADTREECLNNDSAGGISGMILWIGIIGSLAATVMLVMSMLGKTLPGGIEKHGRISSWVSGGLILLAAIIWVIMKDNLDDNLSNGMSVYLTLFAGLLAVGAGVLDLLDKRE